MSRERFALIVICCHTLAALVHGGAHALLDVPVGGIADAVLIVAAVYLGPLAALAELVRGRWSRGALLLSLSMSVALIYGLTFHFLLSTPDNVMLIPQAGWGAVFRGSAVLIALLEAVGVGAGVLLMPGFRRSASSAGSRRDLPTNTLGKGPARALHGDREVSKR